MPHPGPKQPAGTGLTLLYNTPRARLQAGRPGGQPVATHNRWIYQRTWWRVDAATTKMLLTKLIGEIACPSWAYSALLVLLGQHSLFELTGGPTTFHHLVDGGWTLRHSR